MWIAEFRESKNLDIDDLARAVNLYRRYAKEPLNGIVSCQLIHILEVCDNAVTHPLLANAIAAVCGATQEQRDSIVSESHRGTWNPEAVRRQYVIRALRNAKDFNQIHAAQNMFSNESQCVQSYGPRPVVKVDRMGNTIQSYCSVTDAARDSEIDSEYVRRRCDRAIHRPGNLFTPDGYTFRYAEEWDKMTQPQKLKDVNSVH